MNNPLIAKVTIRSSKPLDDTAHPGAVIASRIGNAALQVIDTPMGLAEWHTGSWEATLRIMWDRAKLTPKQARAAVRRAGFKVTAWAYSGTAW